MLRAIARNTFAFYIVFSFGYPLYILEMWTVPFSLATYASMVLDLLVIPYYVTIDAIVNIWNYEWGSNVTFTL